MKYIFDIDNTICKTEGEDYANAEPYPERIKIVNDLYDQGHEIVYQTARGDKTGISWLDLTRTQLYKWGCKYRSLGEKHYTDFFIDDKAINSKDFFK